MRASFFSLLFLSTCLLSFLTNSHCNEASQLLRFINATRSSPSLYLDPEQDGSNAIQSMANMSLPEGSKEADKILKLPGQPQGVDFDQYAGYVTVDKEAGRSLFYYFVESPHDTLKKPLVLWLNGGPGCSSFGLGGMGELGPFKVNSDNKTLNRNPFAWNIVANVIFLESETGVGFSFSKKIEDYHSNGDNRTVDDAYTFLINWLDRFPEYKNRSFYLSGESYAGHFVSQLAYKILQHNKEGQTAINLNGTLIGNPYIDNGLNGVGRYEFLYRHSMISEETYDRCSKECSAETLGSDNCFDAMVQVQNEVGSLNSGHIYAPLCIPTNDSFLNGDTEMGSYDPCSEEYIISYLNLPEVQKALHARPGPWTMCSRLSWIDQPASVLSVIKEVIASGIKVWFYSGDADATVSMTSTRLAIKALDLPVKKPWRPWYSNQEVGGYVEQYEGLTFVSVRDAGHTVPSFQPDRALIVIYSFLKGQIPPTK